MRDLKEIEIKSVAGGFGFIIRGAIFFGGVIVRILLHPSKISKDPGEQ